MSKCTIQGCTNEAVARGLCAMHYMRQRRRGDPEAAFKPGRPPKPHPEDPASAALRRENSALREENTALKRRLEEAQARPAAAPGELWEHLQRLAKENSALKKQLANAQAANPGVGPAEEASAGRLAREIDRLKEALAKAEAKLAADPGEVGKLERQLKAAKTRAQNEAQKARLAWEAAKAKGLTMSKADRRKIRRVLHPDHEQDPVRKKRLEQAFQIFEALPIRELNEDS